MSAEHDALQRIDRSRIVDTTCDLIRGRGENPGGTEADTVARLAALARARGASVTTQPVAPERDNLIVAFGPDDAPAVLFLGHSDVVPAGEGWTDDPFVPRVDGDTIIGRGATDMKGGLAAALEAMAAVHAVAPGLRLELVCTVDEEDTATGILAYLEATPARQYLACIVAEPTDLDVVVGCRGATNFTVQLRGWSAHAGRPEDGISSILAAEVVLRTVRELDAAGRGQANGILGAPTWNVGTIRGGSGTSIVPRKTKLTIDRRTLPDDVPSEILDDLVTRVRSALDRADFHRAADVRVRASVAMEMPGFLTDTDEPLVRTATSVLAELGHDAPPTGWSAACEGGFIARHHHAPTIVLGPGDITGQAHQPDETVRIDDLVTAAQAYTLIALRLAASALDAPPPIPGHSARDEGSAA